MFLTVLTTLLAGAGVGIISSVFGLGGGIILVPLLSTFFYLAHNEAIATSLMTIGLITLFNTFHFARARLIHWRLVAIILTTSAVSSVVGGYLATVFDERLLLVIFILFVCYVFAQSLIAPEERPRMKIKKNSLWKWGSIIGLSSGLVSGTTGVGGGAIITPLLFKSKIESSDRVVPLTNAIMMFNAFFALLPFLFKPALNGSLLTVGMIHLDRAILIFVSAIPASMLGTKWQKRISQRKKQLVISVILLVILIRMGLRFFATV